MSGYDQFFKTKQKLANKKSPPKKVKLPGKKKSKVAATLYTVIASALAEGASGF